MVGFEQILSEYPGRWATERQNRMRGAQCAVTAGILITILTTGKVSICLERTTAALQLESSWRRRRVARLQRGGRTAVSPYSDLSLTRDRTGCGAVGGNYPSSEHTQCIKALAVKPACLAAAV